MIAMSLRVKYSCRVSYCPVEYLGLTTLKSSIVMIISTVSLQGNLGHLLTEQAVLCVVHFALPGHRPGIKVQYHFSSSLMTIVTLAVFLYLIIEQAKPLFYIYKIFVFKQFFRQIGYCSFWYRCKIFPNLLFEMQLFSLHITRAIRFRQMKRKGMKLTS